MSLRLVTLGLGVLCLLPRIVWADEDWDEPIATDVVIYEAVVSGTPIKIVASERRFDPSRHTLTDLRNTGTEAEPNWQGATIDGEAVMGMDATLPPKGYPQLDRLTVSFGDQVVQVPRKMLQNVFNPHLSPESQSFNVDAADSIISVSRDGKAVIIDLCVGDGGGTTNVVYVVGRDGKVKRTLPQRPWS